MNPRRGMNPLDELRRDLLNIEGDAYEIRWREPATCRRITHEARDALALVDRLAAERGTTGDRPEEVTQ